MYVCVCVCGGGGYMGSDDRMQTVAFRVVRITPDLSGWDGQRGNQYTHLYDTLWSNTTHWVVHPTHLIISLCCKSISHTKCMVIDLKIHLTVICVFSVLSALTSIKNPSPFFTSMKVVAHLEVKHSCLRLDFRTWSPRSSYNHIFSYWNQSSTSHSPLTLHSLQALIGENRVLK